MSTRQGLIYIGKGASYSGIPSRDLSPEEVDQLGPREQRIVRLSGAWRESTKREQTEADKASKRAEAETADKAADAGKEQN